MNTKLLLAVFTSCLLSALALPAIAQSNNTAGPVTPNLLENPTIQGGVQQIVDAVGSATNYAIAPYATYAPNIAAKDKWGGGVLGIYNLNNYVGTALGVDWLGQFTLISGNITLQVPVYPFRNSPIKFLRSVVVTPLGILGIGHPFAGTSSGVAEIMDAGGEVRFGHFLGGTFGVGATYGKWTNAGDYSGTRYHAFADLKWGF